MKRTLGALIAAIAVVLIGLSVYRAGEGALSQGGTCAAGATRFVIARRCPEDAVIWAIGIPASVFLLLIGLVLNGLKNDLRGAWLYQAFFLSLGLGLLFAGLSSNDSATRWFGAAMCLVMAPVGSTFLIVQWVRRRQGSP